MAAGWPPGVTTAPCACGTRRTWKPRRACSAGTRIGSGPWPTARMAAGWPPGVATAPCACGTRRTSKPRRACSAGTRIECLVRGLQPGWPLAGLRECNDDSSGTVRVWDTQNLRSRAARAPRARGRGLVRGLQPGWPLAGLRECRPHRALWDTQNLDAAPRVLRGHEDWVIVRGLQPRWPLAGLRECTTRTVRVWDTQNPRSRAARAPAGTRTSVSSVAYSPDGRWLASGSGDGTVRLWDTRNLGSRAARAPRARVEWSGPWPTARMAAGWPPGVPTAPCACGTRRTWKPRRACSSGHERVSRPWPTARMAAGWPPGVTTAPCACGTRRTSKPRRVVLSGHEASVTSVAYSPDGRWLASGSDDRTVRVWDTQNLDAAPRVLQRARGIGSGPWPTARMAAGWPPGVATTCRHGARVGHAEPGSRAARAQRARGWVRSVAYSPDGRWLASGSADRTVRVWLVDLEELAAIGCRKAHRNLTREEWNRYLGDLPYEKTCAQWPEGNSILRVSYSVVVRRRSSAHTLRRP